MARRVVALGMASLAHLIIGARRLNVVMCSSASAARPQRWPRRGENGGALRHQRSSLSAAAYRQRQLGLGGSWRLFIARRRRSSSARQLPLYAASALGILGAALKISLIAGSASHQRQRSAWPLGIISASARRLIARAHRLIVAYVGGGSISMKLGGSRQRSASSLGWRSLSGGVIAAA